MKYKNKIRVKLVINFYGAMLSIIANTILALYFLYYTLVEGSLIGVIYFINYIILYLISFECILNTAYNSKILNRLNKK